MPQHSTEEKLNISSVNGLVLSGKKPLSESMLTKFWNIVHHNKGQWVEQICSGVKVTKIIKNWKIPLSEVHMLLR